MVMDQPTIERQEGFTKTNAASPKIISYFTIKAFESSAIFSAEPLN